MKRSVLFVFLAFVLLAGSGCETMRSSWKGTKKLYKSYINVDPTVDLQAAESCDPLVKKLAVMVYPVDQRLDAMIHDLTLSDMVPEPDWPDTFFLKHNWVANITLISMDGALQASVPTRGALSLDAATLEEMRPTLEKRQLMAMVDESGSSPTLILMQPIFTKTGLAGVSAVTVDPAGLARLSNSPDQLMIFTPKTMLWSGGAGAAGAIMQQPWPSILKSEVCGEKNMGGTKYLWQARYQGQLQLIYATEATVLPEDRKENKAKDQAKPQAPAANPDAAASTPAQ